MTDATPWHSPSLSLRPRRVRPVVYNQNPLFGMLGRPSPPQIYSTVKLRSTAWTNQPLGADQRAILCDVINNNETLKWIGAEVPAKQLRILAELLISATFWMLEQTGNTFDLDAFRGLIEEIACDIPVTTLRLFQNPLPQPFPVATGVRRVSAPEAALIEYFDHALPMKAWWQRARFPSCDQVLPEVAAVLAGPDALRDFVACGGNLGTDLAHTNRSLSHYAACAVADFPGIMAVFVTCGGSISEKQNHDGDTPWHLFIDRVPEALSIWELAHMGVKISTAGAILQDSAGRTLQEIAAQRGPEFAAATRALLERIKPEVEGFST